MKVHACKWSGVKVNPSILNQIYCSCCLILLHLLGLDMKAFIALIILMVH